MNLYELRNVELERTARDYTYRLRIESLTIRAGEKIALIGPSGCGKSTALDLLALILRPSRADTFRLETSGGTEDVTELWRRDRQERMARIRLQHIGYVLQTGGLLPFLNGADNIAAPGRAKGLGNVETRIGELADRLGIPFYNREIITMASEDSGVNAMLFSDERLKSDLISRLRARYRGDIPVPNDSSKSYLRDEALFSYQVKIIERLADQGPCVLIGRCADYILRNRPDVVRVFVHADPIRKIGRASCRERV